MSPYAILPVLPLLAFAAIALGGRRLGSASHRIAIAAVAVSFALSLSALVEVLNAGPFTLPLATWFRSGALVVEAGLSFDGLGVALAVLVTGVGGLVHVFSWRYLQGDPRYTRFFAVLALFTGAMLMVVLSTNLLVIFLFWEIMGLCSYLLISHNGDRPAAARAATTAFLVNAVADAGLGAGILLTYRTFGTLDLVHVLEAAPAKAADTVNLMGWAGLNWAVPSLTLIGLLIFWGAMGKSAQFPLHVWLPYAMEAPTPVSALIHAATMVNAGVYLVARLGPLYQQVPMAAATIALVGGFTALFAGIVALAQSDIKRILAYSTISQLGFMMLANGVGAALAAIFHLVAHGAFKAFLFLSSGSVLSHLPAAHVHAAHDPAPEQARPSRPLLVASLALAAFLPLLLYATPYRRLWMAGGGWPAQVVFWMTSLLLVFLGARACARWPILVFGRRPSSSWDEHARELYRSNRWQLSPGAVSVGAAGAALLWVLFYGFCAAYETLLAPALANGPIIGGSDGWNSGLWWGLCVALAGWITGWKNLGVRALASAPLAEWKTRLYVWALSGGHVDEAFDRWVVAPVVRWAQWGSAVLEGGILDQGLARFARLHLDLASWLWRHVDTNLVDRGINGLAIQNVEVARWLWKAVDMGGVDRAVDGLARQHVGAARWLWKTVDVGGVERITETVGHHTARSGRMLRRAEPRLLHYHVLLLVASLVVAMALVVWIVR